LFFLQSGSTQHVMVGVQLLSQLVCEMNQVSEVSVIACTDILYTKSVMQIVGLPMNCSAIDFLPHWQVTLALTYFWM
jgi:hypothetical protein